MALPIVAKVGGIMAVVGLPIAAIYYVIKNNLFLYEVERKVLEDNVYLKVEEKQEKTEDSKTIYSWKVKVDEQTDTSVWKTDGYSWECTISIDSSKSEIDKQKLESKLPTSTNKDDEWRKNNKAILLYLCSIFKNREQSNNKTLVSSFSWPEDKKLDELFRFKQEST